MHKNYKTFKTLILFSCLNNSILFGMDNEKTYLLQQPLKKSSGFVEINITKTESNLLNLKQNVLHVIKENISVTDDVSSILERYTTDLNSELIKLPDSYIENKQVQDNYFEILKNLLIAFKKFDETDFKQLLTQLVIGEFKTNEYLSSTNLFLNCLIDISEDNLKMIVESNDYIDYECIDSTQFKYIVLFVAVCTAIGTFGLTHYLTSDKKGKSGIIYLITGFVFMLLGAELLACSTFNCGCAIYKDSDIDNLKNIIKDIQQILASIRIEEKNE